MPSKSNRGLSPSKSRSSGFKGAKSAKPTARKTATRPPKPPKLPGEKSVRPTAQTVGVKPAKPSKIARTPLDPNAVDRRRQIVD